ncbi:hypothetical protein GCM10007063_25760 [Lentibacillus kapialis]|uniref:Excalibur calcium-binding domain-containing protein n=1 Tax=Lentibacillus kapialis TaxID=340214 RepID=A0A917UZW9_9BACI|nr:hypothetical protein [Lentibacillus kapialis]GGK02302.1 hypothetical protein GCM10007063_25760 [Lentibacillus kapialis]
MKSKHLTLAVLLSALFMFGTAQSVFANHSGDLDCKDFDTQAEAQAHLEEHPNDPDGLDKEGDGLPCENLPAGDSDASSSDDTPTSENDTDSEATSSEESTSSEEDASSESKDNTSSEEQGGELPDTATVLPLGILGGLGAMALGALGIRKRQ